MKLPKYNKNTGFSLIELIIAMSVMLVLLTIVSTLLAGALSTRQRESRKTDALVSAQAALNLMSRELSNAGFGLTGNGIVTADSNSQRLHFRANIENTNQQTNSVGEDLTYYFDAVNECVMRYDRNANPQTSVVVSRISSVNFRYFEYDGNSAPIAQTAPTSKTSRITINITVELEPVTGQPDNQTISLTTDVMLKNSKYMLNQY